jgi:choline dehydrogenase-like flavoprotein
LSDAVDVIVVGAGAAGAMAAFRLAHAGIKVLLLDAGPEVDTVNLYRSAEWPYESDHHWELPAEEHPLAPAEYRMLARPYGRQPEVSQYKKVLAYPADDFSRNVLVNEKEHPFTGTPFAWVRARALGGRTLFWGRCALRLSNYDFKAKTHDGFGEDWPIGYEDLAPYYDQVDRLLGISGTREHLPQLPDGIFQRPVQLNCGERILKDGIRKMGRTLIPGRAGVTTDGVANKYRAHCLGRGGCARRGGCDINAAFHAPSALIYPARDTGNLQVLPNTITSEVIVDERANRVTGVVVFDRVTKQRRELRAGAVVLAASTLETTRLLLNSRSRAYPTGLANSSGVVGRYLCEHVLSGGARGYAPSLMGRDPPLEDGRPIGAFIPRFRNLKERRADFIRGYNYQVQSGATMAPPPAPPGFGQALKLGIRKRHPALVVMAGFGEVLPRYENHVDIDPEVRDAWGIPSLRFHYQFGPNELAMAKDMAEQAEEMLHAAGCEEIRVRKKGPLPEGFSIHEVGTARMGDDRKTSVTTSFGQTHDVKNLFLLDGSIFVSAGSQNPTWTILALSMRGADHLAERIKRREL